jgi:Ca2+/H+ antiporter
LGKDMDLNFEIFMVVLLVLAIVVVGNFLRDGESNYLEGALLVVSLTDYALLVDYLHRCRLFISSLRWHRGTTRTLM